MPYRIGHCSEADASLQTSDAWGNTDNHLVLIIKNYFHKYKIMEYNKAGFEEQCIKIKIS
jgi:hypothetical protein